MKNSLATVSTGVDHRPETAGQEPLFAGHLGGRGEKPTHELALSRALFGKCLIQAGHMGLGDHQEMRLGLRTDVADADERVILKNPRRRDFALDDLAEEAV